MATCGCRPSSMGIWCVSDRSFDHVSPLPFPFGHPSFSHGPNMKQTSWLRYAADAYFGDLTFRPRVLDRSVQEPNRLDPPLHRLRPPNPRPHPRHRPSIRRLAVLQHSQLAAHARPLDAHVHHSQPIFDSEGVHAVHKWRRRPGGEQVDEWGEPGSACRLHGGVCEVHCCDEAAFRFVWRPV